MPIEKPVIESIVLAKRVVFLHIAKTAGTSIVHFFRKHLQADTICSHGDFLHLSPDRLERQQLLERYQFVSGHFGYDEVVSLLPGAYSFTFLRDPVDRVLSFYQFCLHRDMQRQFPVARAAKGLGLDGFIHSMAPEVVEAMDNLQCWQLARSYWCADRNANSGMNDAQLLDLADAHLQELSYVGLTETFDSDFKKILMDIGIERKIPKGRQFVTANPIARETLKASSLATLQQRVAADTQLHNLVQSRRSLLAAGAPQ